MYASSLLGELGGEAATKHHGQKLRCMNQRGAIPEGESSRKYAETPVGSLPTGVSFVPFCPFPGLSAFYPRMGQIWVKEKTTFQSQTRMCQNGSAFWPTHLFPFRSRIVPQKTKIACVQSQGAKRPQVPLRW
jgi:hypothetical protein